MIIHCAGDLLAIQPEAEIPSLITRSLVRPEAIDLAIQRHQGRSVFQLPKRDGKGAPIEVDSVFTLEPDGVRPSPKAHSNLTSA